jgi:hypothetical protein
MRTIEITIDPDGEIKVAGKGFKGAECEAALAEFEEILGQVTESKKTPEWFQQNANTQKQRA